MSTRPAATTTHILALLSLENKGRLPASGIRIRCPRLNPLKSLLITVMSRHSTGRGRSRVEKRRIKLFKN